MRLLRLPAMLTVLGVLGHTRRLLLSDIRRIPAVSETTLANRD